MKIKVFTDSSKTDVQGVYIADEVFAQQQWPDRWEVEPEAPPAPKRLLTKLEYMNRFTDAELAGIYTAAKSVVAVEVWLEKFKVASDINLDDPRTGAGVQALEDAGLLATGRAEEILA